MTSFLWFLLFNRLVTDSFLCIIIIIIIIIINHSIFIIHYYYYYYYYYYQKTLRAVDLATHKGPSSWLTVLPIRDMNFDLQKSEFRDALKLRYDWEVPDTPSVCVCGDIFNVNHATICKRGGFIIQRHNELRDLEAELLPMVCNGVETEPVLQNITGEELNYAAMHVLLISYL